MNTSIQPHSIQDYLYLTFKGDGTDTESQKILELVSKRARGGAGGLAPPQLVQRRWITELEVLQPDRPTAVCVTVAEQLVHLLLAVRKPPNHLSQEALQLRLVGAEGPGGFVHGNLKPGFTPITWDKDTCTCTGAFM